MKGMSQYGAVATKIRAMRSHLLKKEEYEYIANCSSVTDMINYLKGHPGYSAALQNMDTVNLRREYAERHLANAVFMDIEKISHFLDNKQKKFLAVYSTIFELRFLNNVLRCIFNKYTDISGLTVYRPMFENTKNFRFDAVIQVTDIPGLIDALSGSIYQPPIQKTYEMLENAKLFDYETSLSRFYFSNFWSELEKFHSSFDKETLLEVHGVELDLLNIIWVYRTKAYYDVPPRDIFQFLIPAHHKLKQSQLTSMVLAESPEEVLRLVEGTYYSKYISREDNTSLERAYNETLSQINAKTRLKYPYSFAVIESYIYDKRIEAERIIRIAESVRYGYDPALILKVLQIS